MIGRLRANRGFTLIETMVAVTLLSAALIVMMSLMVTMLNMWRSGSGGASANSNTAIAVRKLVLDIEEGRSAALLDTYTEDDQIYGSRLQVSFPHYNTSSDSYVRTVAGSTVIYYLSGQTGTEATGDRLWRYDGSSRRLLAKNVDALRFTLLNGKLVGINLKGKDPEAAAVSPNFLQVKVRLRNS